jgi:hypothetical protein
MNFSKSLQSGVLAAVELQQLWHGDIHSLHPVAAAAPSHKAVCWQARHGVSHHV